MQIKLPTGDREVPQDEVNVARRQVFQYVRAESEVERLV
jgi:hypothetical protein